jgi:hypothetical protein
MRDLLLVEGVDVRPVRYLFDVQQSPKAEDNKMMLRHITTGGLERRENVAL